VDALKRRIDSVEAMNMNDGWWVKWMREMILEWIFGEEKVVKWNGGMVKDFEGFLGLDF
jgi:hypothetical protein